MKISGSSKQQLVNIHGPGFQIYFDEVQIGDKYEYYQCEVTNSPTRQEVIESMIASRYSFGAEFAAINNLLLDPDGYNQYQQFRALVKEIADEVLKQIYP